MFATVDSAALCGVDAVPVRVECHVAQGLPRVLITGLPDNAIREAVPRIVSAAKLSGIDFRLTRRIVVNLVPGDLRKSGSSFDLPIALGILAAMGECPPEALEGRLVLGELALDGRIEPVRGVLSLVAAAGKGTREMIVPEPNVQEALAGSRIKVVAPGNLSGALDHIRGRKELAARPAELKVPTGDDTPAAGEVGGVHKSGAGLAGSLADLADVRGQALARRALEVAAAGGHNLLMIGSPGSGKTLLARCLPGILPCMVRGERLETSRIHSVAGLLPPGSGLLNRRPFRAPHATISDAGLIGSGRFPHVGEISLAHRGVLFLDEFPEFRRGILEQLRQPLEDGRVLVSRAGFRLLLPSDFMLVAAMNPCPCGYLGDPLRACRCGEAQVAKYRGRVSGPILDRIDLHVELPGLLPDELLEGVDAECSDSVRRRVGLARGRQRERYREVSGLHDNAGLARAGVRRWCRPDAECLGLLRRAAERHRLSARAMDRVLRVARTVADLEASDELRTPHLAEALQLRCPDFES